MFYVPWNGNDTELARLLECIERNRTDILDGKMCIRDSTHGDRPRGRYVDTLTAGRPVGCHRNLPAVGVWRVIELSLIHILVIPTLHMIS